MKSNTAQKSRSSTQKFTEIEDIKEDIALLAGGNACLVIEVQATNFTLLSVDEQHAKLVAYASLLNSLSFPIQIIIRNKRVDISSYLKFLDAEIQKTQTSIASQTAHETGEKNRNDYIKKYRIFVEDLIKVNTVLNKAFYVVVSYSFLEKGISGVGVKKKDFFLQAKTALHTKAESLLSQLERIGLKSKITDTDGLIKLFYDIYNQEAGINSSINQTVTAPIVRGV